MENNEQEDNEEDRLSVAKWAGGVALVGGLVAGAIEVAAVSFSIVAILPGFSVGLAAWYAIPTALQWGAIGGGLGGAGAAIYNHLPHQAEEQLEVPLVGDGNAGIDG